MVLMNLFAGQQWRRRENGLVDRGGGRRGWDGQRSSMKTHMLSYVR